MISAFPHVWQEKLEQNHFTELTPIQKEVFKAISQDKHVLGISPTGTGKTLAYLFPSLLRLKKGQAQQLLILAPNTELAAQIFKVAKDWAEPLHLTAQLFISGASQKRQINRLKKGPEILIGTPGRVFELVKLKKIKMMAVNTIILDEFDELLKGTQYSFAENIIKRVARRQQIVYMGATQKIDKNRLEDGTIVVDLSEQKLDRIVHYYIQTDKRSRIELLRKFANIPDFRALVFFNSLSDLGACEERLQYRQLSVASIASDVGKKQRKETLEHFKDHELSLLLATDLAARGIDIEGLEYVINFEPPHDRDTYTHRAGRTGRMGQTGTVITFISHKEEFKKLKKYAPVSEIFLKNQELRSKGQ